MHLNLHEYFCLIISFLSIFWIVIIYTFSPNLKLPNEYHSKHEILNMVGNGDLLFLSGNTFAEKVIKFWHNSYYSHVALIFEEDNTLFVWESDVGQGTKDGPRIIKLIDKLNRWKGDKIGMIRKYQSYDFQIPPSTKHILDIATNYVNRGMDTSMISWFFSNFPNSYIFQYLKRNKDMFCSELVAETLQHLEIIKCDKNPVSYTPQDFTVLIPDKGFYSFPIYFVF